MTQLHSVSDILLRFFGGVGVVRLFFELQLVTARMAAWLPTAATVRFPGRQMKKVSQVSYTIKFLETWVAIQ